MPRQNLPEAVAGLTPEQRAERRRQVLNAVGALASEPDFSRQMFRARVGGQLAALVARAGVSAAKLARKLNISPSQLSRQLAGDANLTLNSLHDIAGAAGATVRLQFESVHQFGAGLQDAVTHVRHDTSHMVGAPADWPSTQESGGMRMRLGLRQITSQVAEFYLDMQLASEPFETPDAANESMLQESKLTLPAAA